MSAATVAPQPRRFRLVRAEVLKLRKHRGLVLTTGLLTIGIVVLVYGILVLLHVFNPDHHGPAGGVDNLRHAMELMSVLGAAVAATLVGSFAATGDVDSGVFRDLVVTGRSRTDLFLARVPGGLAVLWVFVAAAYVLAAVLAVTLAGTNQEPSLRLLIETGLWLELGAAVVFSLALGVGSLIGSRAASIVIVLAWVIVVQPILTGIGSLGTAGREWLARAAIIRLSPLVEPDRSDRVPMSAAAAVVVLLLWIVVPLAAGLWRTKRRDA